MISTPFKLGNTVDIWTARHIVLLNIVYHFLVGVEKVKLVFL